MNIELLTRLLQCDSTDQTFMYECKDRAGGNVTHMLIWNVTRAIALTQGRDHDGLWPLENMQHALLINDDPTKINMHYAPFLPLARLQQPLLAVAMADGTHIIIDGWQRIYRAVQARVEMPLCILTPEEDQQCRIYDVIYL